YLLRYYGFTASDVVYEADGSLPLGNDPKVAWALANPQQFPVDVAAGSYEMLVRVPGIGVATAKRLVNQRRTTTIRGLADLRRLGVQTGRAAGFLTLRGRVLEATRWTEQLAFWDQGDPAGTYAEVYDVSPGTFR